MYNYLQEQTKKNYRRKQKKKVLSQTSILYDYAWVVKPTFVSELDQYINICLQFTIVC